MLDPTGATVAMVALATVLTAVKQVLCYRHAVKFGRHVLDETIKKGGAIDPIQLVRAVNETLAEPAILSILHIVAGLERTRSGSVKGTVSDEALAVSNVDLLRSVVVAGALSRTANS